MHVVFAWSPLHMCHRKVAACFLSPPFPWYKSFWILRHACMYPVVEPLPYTGHGFPSSHLLCVLTGFQAPITRYLILHLLQANRKSPPPLGGGSIYYVPWSRAVCKKFHDEIRRSHFVVKSLTHGSWSGNIVNRKPPRGGGFLSIKAASLPQALIVIK